MVPWGGTDEHEMGEEVGPLDGRNAANHAGHGVPHVHRAAQLRLVHERDELVGEPGEGVVLLLGLGGGAGEVPVEEEHLRARVVHHAYTEHTCIVDCHSAMYAKMSELASMHM